MREVIQMGSEKFFFSKDKISPKEIEVFMFSEEKKRVLLNSISIKIEFLN